MLWGAVFPYSGGTFKLQDACRVEQGELQGQDLRC